MRVDAVLCNHAEVQNNLLYISGGGVEAVQVPPGHPGPYGVTVGLGLVVTVPWSGTHQQHTVEIDMLSEDGQPVMVPTSPEEAEPLHMQFQFTVGRPPDVPSGDEQHICLAANLPGLPVPSLGTYVFRLTVDGVVDDRALRYRLIAPPVQPMAFGPATPGPIG
jgi:hypothetical protein